MQFFMVEVLGGGMLVLPTLRVQGGLRAVSEADQTALPLHL